MSFNNYNLIMALLLFLIIVINARHVDHDVPEIEAFSIANRAKSSKRLI